MEHLRRLVEHLSWADELVQRACASAGERAPARAIELFAHVVAAEHLWFARLMGAKPELPVWPAMTSEEISVVARATHAALRRYVAELRPEQLARDVAYVNSAGRAFTSSVEDILLHVCLHGAYHRGQVADLLRQTGCEPEATDFIAFTRGAPTATRRP